ncbi:hypothetical protein [Reichenbachiella versicolor]|nr:hypothetical protein [Reichenbachiella versicolor]
MSDKKEISIQLSIEELKVVFKALGKLPFEEVYEIIGSLNEQVNSSKQDN